MTKSKIKEITMKQAKDGKYTAPHLDSMGNPIVLPKWFPGSLDEFAEEVHSLRPHHCSFPSGHVECLSGGRCCKRTKTTSGLCREHMPKLIPILHRGGMSPEEVNDTVVALQDPELCDLKMNVVIAERILKRQGDKAFRGGFSDRAVGMFNTIVDALEREYNHHESGRKELYEASQQYDATDVEDSKGRERWQRAREDASKKMAKAIGGWKKIITNLRGFGKMVHDDNENFKDLTSANASSVSVKEAKAKVDVLRNEVTSNDEVRRLFAELFSTIEDTIGRTMTSEEGSNLLMSLYQEVQKNQRATLKG